MNTKVLKLIHSDLCDLHATPSLENKKYFVTSIDGASRAVVRLPDPKLENLGERGIECIFVGYAEHSKAFSGTYKYHKTVDCYGINSQSEYSLVGCEDIILNDELDEEAPKQWLQKFNELVLFNGYLLNQADKYVYSKFDESGKGFIICLYVDDMLIFNTDQVHVHLTRVLKYLKKIIDYSLSYIGYPSVLDGYTYASWISNTEDNSSTSGWVFLLGGGAIS
ncbi:hypothetical protein Tco_1204116 [Tanacetum coccineum]